MTVPDPTEVSAPWWQATREGRLLLQRCRACGGHQHYPRALCTACGGTDLEYVAASGRGIIYSHTTVHRAVSERGERGPAGLEPPYAVALVRLEEGPLLLSNVIGCEPAALRCDQPVRVAWRPLADGRRLPVFTPVERASKESSGGLSVER
jgi:uncharacterized OB-fold protein